MDSLFDIVDELSAAVHEAAGPDDADRLAQFDAHLATCRMLIGELHGESGAAPPA